MNPPFEHPDPSQVERILSRYRQDPSSLVMVLQDLQAELRFLPCEVLEQVACTLGLPRSQVLSVATFYKAFSLEPQGRTVIQVCKGTACHVRGAALLEAELSRQLDVPVGGTTADGGFTLKTVNCVGACALAPVVVVGERYHGDVKPVQVKKLLRQAARTAADAPQVRPAAEPPTDLRWDSPEALAAYAWKAARTMTCLPKQVRVCGGPGCLAAGSRGVYDSIRAAAAEQGLPLRLELRECFEDAEPPVRDEHLATMVGCQGLCEQGPLVHVLPDDTLYTRVKASDGAAIVTALSSGARLEPLLGECPTRSGHPFYRGQEPKALASCGRIDPESLDAYLAVGGFAALRKALFEMSPAAIVDEVDAAGLRGRGGAGFATARKWRTALRAAEASGEPPYVLCNGDEGDPGAFMDRAIMEGAPFQVIEGMTIGSVALGAREGVIYVRAEYPLAVERLAYAIEVCRRVGLLGQSILGSGHDFDIRISRGGGAFVCGESTALMRSIEGMGGEPRAKYVRAAARGLHDRPTVLNNVETWVLVPGIVREGASWLSSVGTAKSKGTKAFSLVGQVERAGLVEVPMGTTLRELIFDIGGGMRDGRPFKAVQTGGPSGGCLPASCSSGMTMQVWWGGKKKNDQHEKAREGGGGRLRGARASWLHDGLGRHDRDERPDLHGRRGPLLRRLPARGVLRQVRAL